MLLPITALNQPGFITDFESDLFIGHVLSSTSCKLYYHYGIFLEPLTPVIATMKHCQFGHQCHICIIDDGK